MQNYFLHKFVCRNIAIILFLFFVIFPPEKLLRSETAKTVTTPLPSNRKAFGLVNKQISTPAVGAQEKKLLKPQVEQTEQYNRGV